MMAAKTPRVTAAFKESLKSNVSGIVPHLDEEELKIVVDFLVTEGVKKDVDLYRMTIPILKDVLTTVDATDLFVAWQNAYGPSTSGPSTSGPSTSGNSRQQRTQDPLTQRQQATSASSSSLLSQVPMFDKDHVLMPSGIQEAIKNKSRPSSKVRENMVERFVDHSRKVVANLQRSSFNDLADFLVQTYPDTFKDTVIYNKNRLGSQSLRDQFVAKFDNDNRDKSLRTSKEQEAPARPEAYGCVSWNPELPETETEVKQEEKRTTLLNMFKLARKNWDQKTIKKLMSETFYLQRKDINGELPTAKPAKPKNNRKRKRGEMEVEENAGEVDDPSPQGMKVELVRERWPFLFLAKWMNQHCKTLTGIDFNDAMYQWSNGDSGEILIDMISRKNEDLAYMRRRMVREEKRGNLTAKAPTILLMLIDNFDDKLEAFATFTEKTAEIDDLEEQLFSNDGFPNLVVAGPDFYNAEKFFFCCDHKAIVTIDTFFDALVVLLSSYFVLNVLFATNLACTLFFLQEEVLKLKSTRLPKCVSMDIQKAALKKVSRLSNKFQEFAQKWRQEGEKENQANSMA